MFFKNMFLFLLLVVFSTQSIGCAGGDNSTRDGTDADTFALTDASPDTSAIEPTIVDSGSIFLDDCHGFAHRCEGQDAADPQCGACQYRVRYRGDVCTAKNPCDDLFLYWSAFDCDTKGLQDATTALLTTYSRTVILCAQPIYPGEILPTS